MNEGISVVNLKAKYTANSITVYCRVHRDNNKPRTRTTAFAGI